MWKIVYRKEIVICKTKVSLATITSFERLKDIIYRISIKCRIVKKIKLKRRKRKEESPSATPSLDSEKDPILDTGARI